MEARLDSLGAVELRNALSQKFNVELPATLAFDHPSINAVATHLAALIGLADEELDPTMVENRAHSRESPFHSSQSVFGSPSLITKSNKKATEVFAMSSRFPSPAGAYLLFFWKYHCRTCWTQTYHI